MSQTEDYGLTQLKKIANLARRSLEPGLPKGTDHKPNSAGACLHACILLMLLLKKYGHGLPSVRGGSDGCGARDTTGQWRGHYWTVVRMSSGSEFLVDITADQFGYEPVVVMPLDEASDRYRDGPREDVDAVFKELSAEYGCQDLVLGLTTA